MVEWRFKTWKTTSKDERTDLDAEHRRTWGPRALRDLDTKDGFWFIESDHLGIERWTTKKLWSGRRSLQRFVPSFPHQAVAKVVLDIPWPCSESSHNFPKAVEPVISCDLTAPGWWLRLGHGLAHQQSLGKQGVCRRKLGAKLKGITIPRLVMITTCLMRQDLCCQCNWPRWSTLFSFVPKAFYVLQCCKESKSTSTVCPVVNAGLIGWVQHPIGVLLNLGRLKQAKTVKPLWVTFGSIYLIYFTSPFS